MDLYTLSNPHSNLNARLHIHTVRLHTLIPTLQSTCDSTKHKTCDSTKLQSTFYPKKLHPKATFIRKKSKLDPNPWQFLSCIIYRQTLTNYSKIKLTNDSLVIDIVKFSTHSVWCFNTYIRIGWTVKIHTSIYLYPL